MFSREPKASAQAMNAFEQEQFLDVIDRDEAERRFRAVLDLRPLEPEEIGLAEALNRVLARDVVAPVDVPGFDRSNVDGFAVRAEDTYGASEDQPRRLRGNRETLATGIVPTKPVAPGTATAIATGAIVPRGADAVVMIEHTDIEEPAMEERGSKMEDRGSSKSPAVFDPRSSILDPRRSLLVRRPVAPGANITFAGTDIGRGETVLRRGEILTSRETGVLAALGLERVIVVRRPRVAIVSTGDELVAPGKPLGPGLIYDSNATVLADAVRELGGEPVPFGIVPDDQNKLQEVLRRTLACDIILLSGGTSKGAGDISYRVVANLGKPGIVAHGVALKPGKPLCLAAVTVGGEANLSIKRTIPVVVLPGFPTSAIFTFHEFVAPVIRQSAGRPVDFRAVVHARLPMRVNSERGRTEYLLVGLVDIVENRESKIEDRRSTESSGAVDPRSSILDPRSPTFFRRLSHGERLRLGDHLQPGGRLRDHSQAARIFGSRRHCGGPLAWPGPSAGGPSGYRQPLRWLGLSPGPASRAGNSQQVLGRRQHGRTERGPARRV
jgi:putative molybdopterin biosynthesis protein